MMALLIAAPAASFTHTAVEKQVIVVDLDVKAKWTITAFCPQYSASEFISVLIKFFVSLSFSSDSTNRKRVAVFLVIVVLLRIFQVST